MADKVIKWEYKLAYMTSPADLVALNAQGEAGWEVVCSVFDGRERLLLKREKK